MTWHRFSVRLPDQWETRVHRLSDRLRKDALIRALAGGHPSISAVLRAGTHVGLRMLERSPGVVIPGERGWSAAWTVPTPDYQRVRAIAASQPLGTMAEGAVVRAVLVLGLGRLEQWTNEEAGW